jgi:hypothetical protein
VKKPDGSYRFTVDYRNTINSRTVADSFPSSGDDVAFRWLGSSCYFMDCASFGTISAATGASDHSVRRRRSTNTELHRCRQHRRSRLPACSCRSAVHAHSPLPLQLPCDLHVAARILVLRRLIAHLHRYWLYCRCCHWDCCHGCQCLSLHARHRRHPGWLRSRATIVEQARLGTKGIHSNEWFVWLLLYSLRNRLVNDSSSYRMSP